MKPELIFVSKRDRWAAVMFWGFALFTWGMGIWAFFLEVTWSERIAGAGVAILAGFTILWFWYTTRYRLTYRSLHLHSGPFHTEIPLRKIRAVITSSKGWGMSYALSLKSIQISVEGSRLGYQISPEERAAFMAAIAERCGHLSVSGQDLVS